MDNSSATLLIAILVAGATGMVLWHLLRVLRGVSTRTWRPVPATVTKAWIDSKNGGDDDISYSVHIEYTYTVRARGFTSKRLTFSDASGLDHDEALHLLAGIVAGGEVTAYYNPHRPDQSVIHPGFSEKSFVRLMVSAAIFAIAVGAEMMT